MESGTGLESGVGRRHQATRKLVGMYNMYSMYSNARHTGLKSVLTAGGESTGAACMRIDMRRRTYCSRHLGLPDCTGPSAGATGCSATRIDGTMGDWQLTGELSPTARGRHVPILLLFVDAEEAVFIRAKARRVAHRSACTITSAPAGPAAEGAGGRQR